MHLVASAGAAHKKAQPRGAVELRCHILHDVNVKYKTPEGYKSYTKKGFLTKREALQHEAEMRAKLVNPSYITIVAGQGKQSVQDYLLEWIENHGKLNLRPSTFAGYKTVIKNHIIQSIGHVQLR